MFINLNYRLLINFDLILVVLFFNIKREKNIKIIGKSNYPLKSKEAIQCINTMK